VAKDAQVPVREVQDRRRHCLRGLKKSIDLSFLIRRAIVFHDHIVDSSCRGRVEIASDDGGDRR
jgi:hypothetical protein